MAWIDKTVLRNWKLAEWTLAEVIVVELMPPPGLSGLHACNLIVVPELQNPPICRSGEQADVAIEVDRTVVSVCADNRQGDQRSVTELRHANIVRTTR